MLGFLGTVIGMILSIFEISNAGGNIDMQLLADGLYTAMTTTVAGLIVGNSWLYHLQPFSGEDQ